MAMRSWRLGSLLSPFTKTPGATRQCLRSFHGSPATYAPQPVPPPTPFVPDVETFLSLIGRNMIRFADKFPTWEKLFTLESRELKLLGIEPTRQRRYLLRKREKFRRGDYGPGGDLDHVVDGAAQLRVVEVPVDQGSLKEGATQSGALVSSATLSPGMMRVIVNLPPDATEYKHDPEKPIKRFAHVRIHSGSMIKGPYLKPLKGTNGSAAIIQACEGMWEDKQGRKIYGGERRRDEVMAKKRIEDKKKGTA